MLAGSSALYGQAPDLDAALNHVPIGEADAMVMPSSKPLAFYQQALIIFAYTYLYQSARLLPEGVTRSLALIT